MATIGELLAKIRNGGMNPTPTGDSPYGGVTPGTNAPIAQPDIDDLPDATKEATADYIYQRTKGFERLEEQNRYSLEPDLTRVRLTDATTGNPAPLTTPVPPQEAFIDPEPDNAQELALRDGFEILKRLGFFQDLTGDDGPEYDKNSQSAGHELLNRPDVREKVSAVLATTRFSALTSPDVPFATPVDAPEYDYIDEDGVRKDHPQLEKIREIASFVMNTGRRAKEAYPDAKLVLARDPEASGGDAFGESANLQYGDLNEATGIDPRTGRPDASSPTPSPPDSDRTALDGTSSIGVINSPDFPFGVDSNVTGAAELIATLDLALTLLDPALDLLNGIFGLFSYNAIHVNRPTNPAGLAPGARFGFGNYPLPSEIDFDLGIPTSLPTLPIANAGYQFIKSMNLPIPRFALQAVGDPNDLVKRLVTLGVQTVKNQLEGDPTTVQYWKTFGRKMERLLSEENNFGLPTIPPLPVYQLPNDVQFMQEFKDCGAMQFIRSMFTLAENVSSSGVASGSAAIQPYRFSRVGDLNRMVNSAANRHAASRAAGLRSPLSNRNMPSLLLLPAAFQAGRAEYTNGSTGGSITLHANDRTNYRYNTLLALAKNPDMEVEMARRRQAIRGKLGHPVPGRGGGGAEASRFSREEVEAIENLLEAEHIPFYFHDLRTNEIVSFHAFLNALSDSFSPQFNATGGFGRIEDVQIYQKTTRAIQVDFTLMSYGKKDMKEMYFKMNKLISMVYPQFSRGTMLEHTSELGTTRFVQPFSQVTTATPIIRLRVGDLIKSNYSREGIARLMGISDPDFQVLEPGEGRSIEASGCDEAMAAVVAATDRVPLTTSGQWDGTGWPIGSIVLLDPPYDPLVAFDPATNTASSDRSATIVDGMIGVRILQYIPFSNPLGGTSPNQEEIIIKVELVSDLAVPGFPSRDRIATKNSTGEAITTCMLSYRDIDTEMSAALICYGVNRELFPEAADLITEAGFEPFEEGEIDRATSDMRDRLFGDKNPIMRAFETTAGRGLAGVITSLNFDWGLNDIIDWDVKNFGYKAPKGCKISISFTPIHDITPGLDSNGMLRGPVFNVAGATPHTDEDVHPDGYDRRRRTHVATKLDTLAPGGE